MNGNEQENNEEMSESVSAVEFDDSGTAEFSPYTAEAPKIIALVMKYSGGWITTERQASYVIGAFVVVIVVVSFFLFTSGDRIGSDIREPGQSEFDPSLDQ